MFKRIILLLPVAILSSIFFSFAQTPGEKTLNWPYWEYDSLFYRSIANDYTLMPYRLYKPKDYTSGDTATKYPLMIMLHGRGEGIGSHCVGDNQADLNLCQLLWGGKMHRDSINKYPSFVIFPQTAGGGWSSSDGSGNYDPESSRALRILKELIELMLRTYPIDLDRVYIHGLSGGGQGVWEMFIQNPGLFAAASPHAATGNLDSARYILFSPLWTVVGETDNNPYPANAVKMMDSLAKYGANPIYTYDATLDRQIWPNPSMTNGEPIYTLVPRTGHTAWPILYDSPVWLNWFYYQNKRRIRVIGEPVLCKDKSKSVTMGISPGLEEYEWRRNGIIIPGAKNHSITVFEKGTYQVRFKRKKYYFNGPVEWSDWSFPVDVIEQEALPAPIITANGTTALNGLDGRTNVTLSVPAGYSVYEWSNGATENSITVSTPGTYYVRVNQPQGCMSQLSIPVVVTTGTSSGAPFAPSDLTANTISRTQLSLSWKDNSENEKGFEIYRKTGAGNYVFVRLTEPNQTSFTDSGLLSETEYTYRVRAINNDGFSGPSNESSATTLKDITPPSMPANLRLTHYTNTSVRVNWTSSQDDSQVKGYIIYLNNDSIAFANSTPYVINGLLTNNFYTVKVAAIDNSGNKSRLSQQVSFYASVKGLNYSFYQGDWNSLPNFNSMTPVTSGWVSNFDIGVRPSSVADRFGFRFTGTIYAPISGNYTFWTNSDDGSKLFINGNQIVNNDGLHGPQDASGNIYLSQGPHSIEVTFFEKTGGEGLTVSWQYQGISRTNIPDAFLASNIFPATTPPAVPNGLTATGISATKIRLNWNDVSNETGYEIFRATSSGGTYSFIATTRANQTTFTDSLLAASSSHFYRVRSVGPAGESALSGHVTGTTLGTPATVPSTPGGLMVTNVSPTTVSLSWNDLSNNEDQYELQYSADSVSYNTFVILPINTTSYTAAGLPSNARFYFRVRASNSKGSSGFSNIVQATTLVLLPDAPSDFHINLVSAGEILLKWKDNANNETGYLLERKTDPEGQYVKLAELSQNTDTFVDRGEAGNNYSYRLSAFNNVGYSSPILFSVSIPSKPHLPDTSDWRIAALAVSHNSSNSNLSNALLNKGNFFQKITIPAGQNFTLNIKLPSLQNDAMLTFNIEDNTPNVLVSAAHSSNSTNGSDGTWASLANPYIYPYTNKLQKLDIPQSLSGQWIRISFQNNATSVTDLKEFALYQFPSSGKAQYFIIIGASIMEGSGNMSEYYPQFKSYFTGKNYDPVIFNLAIAGYAALDLNNAIDNILANHPKASYVMVHVGGNDVKARRPLTFDKFAPGEPGKYTRSFLTNYEAIIQKIKNSGKIPLMADLTFRNYTNDPKVNNGLNQEVGSLPYNYLINQMLKINTPEFYDSKTRRGKIDFYPETLNNQSLLYDGTHITSSNSHVVRNWWIKFGFNYIYEGKFAPPAPYTEFRPNLVLLANTAVQNAENSGTEEAIWNARVLVEEIEDYKVRVPLHIRLDEIDPKIVVNPPAAPSNVAATTSQVNIQLSWEDNSDSEAYFQIYRATSEAGPYTLISTLPTDSLSYLDTNLPTSATFYYKIRAGNKGGWSAFSEPASATTQPSTTFIWDGEAGNDWSIDQNWSNDSKPGAGSIVKLNNQIVSGSYVVNLEENIQGVEQIEVGDTQVITLNISGMVQSIGLAKTTALKINQKGIVRITKPVQIEGNVIIDGQLNIIADSIIFKGDVTGSGILSLSPDCKVIYRGNASQLFPYSYRNLSIDVNDSILVTGPTEVTGRLELQNGKLKSQNNFTVNLDNGYVALDNRFKGFISGRMKAKKSVNRARYNYISVPFSNIAKSEFTQNGSIISAVYRYDETDATRIAGNKESGWTTVSSQLPEPGIGLGSFLKKAAVLEFSGNYNNSTALINITYTPVDNDPETDGWNLIGNPFLSDLDWDQVAAEINGNNMDKAIYLYNGVNYTYEAYVPGFPQNSPLKSIAPLQAFFVHATKPGIITFNNKSRENQSSGLYRTAAPSDQLSIELSDGSLTDKTYIRILPDATNQFDGELDAYKMESEPTYPNIFTRSGQVKYSINTISEVTDSIRLSLVVNYAVAGTMTLRFKELAYFRANQIYLIDEITKSRTKITDGFVYNFNHDPAVTNRFTLVLKNDINHPPLPVKIDTVVIYRINCGGGMVPASPINWSADIQAAPSQYLAPFSSNNTTGSNKWSGVNTTKAPNEIFGPNRLDAPWGGEMEYIFPADTGDYIVRLYYSERIVNAPNNRVFGISIENLRVESAFDIYALAGRDALEKEYLTNVSDRSLNIRFHPIIHNPQINGIEILQLKKTLENYRQAQATGGAGNTEFASTVYPNPVTSEFAGNLEGLYSGEATVQLINLQGKVVYETSAEINHGKYNSALPAEIEPGFYLLKVITDERTFVTRIQKK